LISKYNRYAKFIEFINRTQRLGIIASKAICPLDHHMRELTQTSIS